MKRNKLYIVITLLVLAVIPLLLISCDLELSEEGPAADGIVIYSNREVLNNREVEIVEKRGQQLRATSPAGQSFVWESSNPASIDVDKSGFIRAGQGVNKTSVISVYLKEDPSIRAEVTFRIKGLR